MSHNDDDDDSGRACAENGIKRMFNIFRNDATLSLYTEAMATENKEREKKEKKNETIFSLIIH